MNHRASCCFLVQDSDGRADRVRHAFLSSTKQELTLISLCIRSPFRWDASLSLSLSLVRLVRKGCPVELLLNCCWKLVSTTTPLRRQKRAISQPTHCSSQTVRACSLVPSLPTKNSDRVSRKFPQEVLTPSALNRPFKNFCSLQLVCLENWSFWSRKFDQELLMWPFENPTILLNFYLRSHISVIFSLMLI